ncbi:hypothetical protein HMPREF9318_00057 [Streptococcus urinalis FB127-CNA-2]|uniref:Uncharacterized protein n=1 Tax=Streptococcus urinalis 2285-97 TaxID=764291 RepID=G5KEG3_9STRE|nr:hypothetical protein [Streptococcus urinalis]QBX22121.1 hypothetical protein Javan637_0013 [Streptococcus phage Javan637]QBX31577.1 hypothetical protein Javan642_0013 [Streptococcus phage Javan642]QBX31678.1 hypothetical protein Javan648_0052 [Streptococcus phage Javan648]EHJ57300.1 hypothetical protein STRUR_0797 [Streptococcus urinalis 2285-97]EKS21859.1 hypothetical protein HMPREF9318_00057 [Streptococcus urinalis FB127-CNA-2]
MELTIAQSLTVIAILFPLLIMLLKSDNTYTIEVVEEEEEIERNPYYGAYMQNQSVYH